MHYREHGERSKYNGLFTVAHIRFYRIPLDLRTHLWVIRKLIVTLEEVNSTAYDDFISYIIASCHHKMFRRFEHPWSSIYY